MSAPRVALVHDQLLINAGSEAVFREIAEMFPDADVLCSVHDENGIRWLKGRNVRQTLLGRMPKARSKHYLYSPMMLDVWARVDLREYDVLLCDSHSFAHAARGREDALKIVYYHSPARALWMPEIDDRANTGRLAPVKRALAKRMRPLDYAAGQRWDVRMANSRTTADRVARFYEVPGPQVVYPGVDVDKFADVERTGDDAGLLMWSRLIPYKRFDLFIRAARELGIPAHIVGDGPERAALEALAEGAPNVHFHGRLPDAELKALMGRVRAFVFPAYEDFGIVVAEALSAGIPAVVYDQGGAAEIVRPQDGVLIPAQTVGALVEGVRALDRVPFDPAETRAHARRFSVARFREEYRAVVRQAAAARGLSL